VPDRVRADCSLVLARWTETLRWKSSVTMVSRMAVGGRRELRLPGLRLDPG